MKINEIIVVEGKSDTVAIQRALNADTIETNGSAINKETLEIIELAQKRRGVIIFTDPDYPGEKIRKTISQAVPGCKHAFLTRREAYKDNKSSLGIEHASPEVIRKALQDIYTEARELAETIPFELLVALGFIGGKESKRRRERLCEYLKIGYTNGKQLYKRLNMFKITLEEFDQAISHLFQEENE